MGYDEKRRQKALLRKKKKDKERKKASGNAGLFEGLSVPLLIRRSGALPVHECLINDNWRERGIANILLSRRQTDGFYVIGVYLVDVFCLGVKNTFCNAGLSEFQYDELKAKMAGQFTLIGCELALAHAIVHGAIKYARKWGFEPQKDFSLSRYVLGEGADWTGQDVIFGRDGKPCYIAGPHDDVDAILRKLTKTAGEGNYVYIAPFL